jgi:hypothetical protein
MVEGEKLEKGSGDFICVLVWLLYSLGSGKKRRELFQTKK